MDLKSIQINKLSDVLVQNMMKRSPDDCNQTNDLHNNCQQNQNESQKDLLYINVYIPELQTEQTVICSKYERIWNVKKGLIERSNNLVNNDLNYGFFCASFGHFLDEELNLNNYFSESIEKCCNRIRLELLYKQRIKVGEVMSTLPPATTTRRRRKRTRLLTAVQNGNVEKVAKILLNCDPNFVDESNGETPLSCAATSQSSTTSAVQRIIVCLVNGGALLDFRTKDGRTAIHCAVQKSNYVALKTLLDLGASPNYVDSVGLTALYYSIIHESNPKLTQLLLHEHSIVGITDQHGWQEVHHACKLGLVAHLEQLLYYGCDMNCRIVGSGNTPLHVSAINDQLDCARVLLLRGCDTNVTNNSHQNAYQVAVIAGNMSLAELISNHKPEMVVPYRDKPKYNPARRAPHTQDDQHSTNTSVPKPCPSSPSLSCATSTTTTTSSSGVCCEDGSQSDGAGEDDQSSSEDESSVRPVQLLPGMTVCAVADYNSGDPTHLALRRNDLIVLLPNAASPPTIANQKLLLGRRCLDGKEGLFPTCCVEKVKSRVEGRRDQKYSATTLPARGRSHQKHFLKNPDSQSGSGLYHERTVTLQRGSKGFGFVLRGAKSLTNQALTGKQSLIGLQYLDEIESQAVAEAAGLKKGDFLLAVNGQDVRHMTHEMVVQLIRQSGDRVTMTVATPIASSTGQNSKQFKSILKNSNRNDKTDSTVNTTDQLSTSVPTSHAMNALNDTQMHKFSTLPRNSPSNSATNMNTTSRSTSRGRAPPQPPKRDPTTTLSIGRARARSLLIPNTSGQSSDKKSSKSDINSGLDYDSEGRSEGQSSSPTTSIESMIVNNQFHPNDGTTDGSKVASIRSRSTRRISSYELQEFFDRQTDESKPTVKTYDSMTALKKKKKASNQLLHKNYNSTPDIQQSLEQMGDKSLQNTKAAHLSNSEEKLFLSSGIYAQTVQTVALRGGKIISNNTDDQGPNDSSKTNSRAPPPAYPPPPPPPPTGPGVQTSVIKLTLSQTQASKHSLSDYANYESFTQNQQMLSSFRPVADNQNTTTNTVPEKATGSTIPKAPAPPPGSQMKAAKQPSTRQDVRQTSVYTRQDTMDGVINEPVPSPHIPEPDYWSEEELDVERNRDLSTFKANKTEEMQKSDETADKKIENERMTQSFVENRAKTNPTNEWTQKQMSSSIVEPKQQIISKEELRAQSQKILSKSMSVSSDRQSNSCNNKSVDKSEKIVENSETKDSFSESISKVRKNIREFERRSSACFDTPAAAVPTVVAVTNKKDINIVNNCNNNNTNNNNNNNNNNSIRMSKSCFEVDCCDNSSSGVSSDVEGEYGNKSDRKVNPIVDQTKHIHHNNSEIVSEKMANIREMMIRSSSDATPPSSHQLIKSVPVNPSGQLRGTGHSGSICCAAPASQQTHHYSHQTRRTASVCEDQHKIRQHNCPAGHSLPLQTTTTTNQSSFVAKIVPNSGVKQTYSTSNVLTSGEKTSQPKAVQQSVGADSTLSKSQSNTTQPIRLQIDSLGLAAVNEVDVLAELVPPPPEFAAPPPGHPSKAPQTGPTAAQIQALTQQRQQQIQQIRREQMLRHSVAGLVREGSQPPPIPSQPPPATLPHMCANKEQIRILSPSPLGQTSSMSAHQTQHSHNYPRVHNQIMDVHGRANLAAVPVSRNSAEFGDLLARQRAAQVRAHQQQQIEQQISASMRLGVNTDYQTKREATHAMQSQTLNRQLAHTLNRYVTHSTQTSPYSTQQQSSQQSGQQFATLSRAHQQAMQSARDAAMAQSSAAQSMGQCMTNQRQNYCDYTRLTVQNRLMRHMNASPPVPMGANSSGQTSSNAQQPTVRMVPKPVMDWSCDDVQQWLRAIGMGEHSPKFEYFNGQKLMRLDNNTLIAQGVRQQQHRMYLLEKLKQQILKTHQ